MMTLRLATFCCFSAVLASILKFVVSTLCKFSSQTDGTAISAERCMYVLIEIVSDLTSLCQHYFIRLGATAFKKCRRHGFLTRVRRGAMGGRQEHLH